MNSTEEILAKIDYLPPFPATASKALQQLKNPEVTVEEIAEIIKFDQGITTNILRLCNSSYFGIQRQVTKLSEAVVYIGLSELKKILIVSATGKFYEKKQDGYEMESGELWRHSLSTAIIAEKTIKELKVPKNENVFISGLLHDVGKLVLSEFVSESAEKIYSLVEDKKMSFMDAEVEVLSIDHAELGARVLEMWNFPEEVVATVRTHHHPYKDGDSNLENVIKLADAISMMMGFGTTFDGMTYQLSPEICDVYGIEDTTIFEKIMAESLEEIQDIESSYQNNDN